MSTDLTHLLKTLDEATEEARRERGIIHHLLMHARGAVNKQHQIVASLTDSQARYEDELRRDTANARQAQFDLDMNIRIKAQCECRERNCPHVSRITVAKFHRDIAVHSMKYSMVTNHINGARLTAAEKKDDEVNVLFALLTHFSGYILYLDNGMYFQGEHQFCKNYGLHNRVGTALLPNITLCNFFGSSPWISYFSMYVTVQAYSVVII